MINGIALWMLVRAIQMQNLTASSSPPSCSVQCWKLREHPDNLKITGVYDGKLILMASFTSMFQVYESVLKDSSIWLPYQDEPLDRMYPKLWENRRYQLGLSEFSSGLLTDKKLLFFSGSDDVSVAFDIENGTVSPGYMFPENVIPISTSSKHFYGVKNDPEVTITEYVIRSDRIDATTSDMPICLTPAKKIMILPGGQCSNATVPNAEPFNRKIFAGFVWRNEFYLVGDDVYRFATNCSENHTAVLEQFPFEDFITCKGGSRIWIILLALILGLLIGCLIYYQIELKTKSVFKPTKSWMNPKS